MTIPVRVFLPWWGHFGELIRESLPFIWAQWQPGDIIGGDPVHAALYPGPLEPSLWAPIAAAFPDGARPPDLPMELELEVRAIAYASWPYTMQVGPGWGCPYMRGYEKPVIPMPEPYAVDVVLAPRLKLYDDFKNGWPWAELAAACKAKGWKVGLAGSKRESVAIPSDVTAWELDLPGDTVTGTLRLLKGAKCTVSLDSGIAHLASLVGVPQLVLYANPGDETKSLMVMPGMETMMRFKDMHDWNPTQCWPVFGTVADVISALEVVLSGGTLPAWNASVP